MSSFDGTESKELRLLYARLDDLELRAISGCVAHTSFLTPAEQYKAQNYFSAKGHKDMICLFGGYADAQRRQIFLLPEYFADYEGETRLEMLSDDLDSAISAVRIKGSGFCTLSHRDYLGSLLALGIERSTLGDICILDDSSAILFCSSEIENYILMSLSTVGRDSVKAERITVDKNMTSTQRFQPFSDTVASSRLDCVVASIFNLSREKAQNLIRGGLVEHNYDQASKTDADVSEGDMISARGYGKFVVRDISTQTKKGRIRLFADKYV